MDSKRQAAAKIARRLREKGFQAYFVGGCVRDLVMGREPADYDIATNATPQTVTELFPGSLTVGAQFGVVVVPRQEGDVEVATFRSDGRYTDGRHPAEVRFAKTAGEDVRRRDFTINGLLLDPKKSQILDYVGGQADIRARRIRTIGDPMERFSEDRLRMLRAVRFAARLDFTLDPAALAAIQKLAPAIHDVGKPSTFTIRERIRFDNHVEVGARMAEEILHRLRLPTKDIERVTNLVRHHMRFKDFPKMRRSTALRFIRMPGFDEHLELHRLDCLSSHGDLTNYELAQTMLEETPAQQIKPAPLVTGDDLIAAGFKPGPIFKEILHAVEDAQLEGKLRSREEALTMVSEQFPLKAGA